MKEKIIEYLKTYEEIMSFSTKKKVVVTFFSGYKPSSYYLPQMMIGSKPPESYMAWFCEIFIDNICIYRESRIPTKNETDLEMEEMVLNQLMRQIFIHGVSSAERTIKKYKSL